MCSQIYSTARRSLCPEGSKHMTAIIYAILILITFYVGGICRSIPLMVLSAVECVILLLMLALSAMLLLNISCKFTRDISYGCKNTELKLPVRISNGFLLPHSKVFLCYRYFYNGKKALNKKIKTSLNGNSHKTVKASVKGKYCGIIHVSVNSLKTGDYLGIFRLSKRCTVQTDVLIMPAEKSIDFRRKGEAIYNDISERTHNTDGDSLEIHQIREYRNGDSFKNIHWNISARTDELYYKEYSNSARETISAVIDINSGDISQAEKADAFYELCSAVLLGIYNNIGNVEVYLTDGSEPMLISDKNDMQNVLTKIYYAGSDKKINISRFSDSFIFNSRLELYYKNKLLKRFSSENYENEIKSAKLVV